MNLNCFTDEGDEIMTPYQLPQRSSSACNRDQQEFTFAGGAVQYSNSNKAKQRKVAVNCVETGTEMDELDNPYLSDSQISKAKKAK